MLYLSPTPISNFSETIFHISSPIKSIVRRKYKFSSLTLWSTKHDTIPTTNFLAFIYVFIIVSSNFPLLSTPQYSTMCQYLKLSRTIIHHVLLQLVSPAFSYTVPNTLYVDTISLYSWDKSTTVCCVAHNPTIPLPMKFSYSSPTPPRHKALSSRLHKWLG